MGRLAVGSNNFVMYDSCVRNSHAGMVSISPMHGPMSELWEGVEIGVLTEGIGLSKMVISVDV